MRRFRHYIAACLGIFMLGPVCLPRPKIVPAAAQNDPGWINFTPPDEELAASVPGNPLVRNYPVSNRSNPIIKEEKTLAHRDYDGYGQGLVFVIQSYKAAHPEKLSVSQTSLDRALVFERDLTIDGVAAKLYRKTMTNWSGTYTRRSLRFITAHHLYLITLATLGEINPAVEHFLSGLHWPREGDPVTSIPPSPESTAGYVFGRADVSRPAITVWKREPLYPEEARQKQVAGTIKLEVVFAESGFVTNITVTQALPHGLTESAIEAARHIRFFPAEKDGKPVSQRMSLEYNFNVY